ncbi:catalase family peroxidase [Novosphingobium sp. Fuku2-ISO-50]|uniref:catalase family peroxidase n=1 Tax=Novosphingobium sp. Fuku2-ISO-50 TaxID=1739114 RepID=UPI00076C7C63|nr:catalase family peroxidase [Novosphingobium sp. Fuku2-ISO-50]KUR75314.1 catalase [Novosphingobium sp. Fuku2-ISO-50]
MPPDPHPRMLPRLALTGAILGAIALLFAWVAGWLTPGRVSGGSIVDAMQYNSGKVFLGARRAHAKGLCVSGRFASNGAGATLSRTLLFQAGAMTPVSGRFSLAGGNPDAPDGRNVFHALALRFVLPGGEEWRMALDHTPIFIVSTPTDFQAFQIASKPDSVTKMPDPVRMAAFLASHPETRRFMAYMKSAPLPSSFANGTYYSINAFRFTNNTGETHAVRWQFEPEDNFSALDKASLDRLPTDALFDKYLARASQGPVRWHLVIIPSNHGDATNNAAVQWGPGHGRIDVGTLTLTHAVPEVSGDCRDVVFDPLILPDGVSGSDDPLLAGRSAAYSASFRRRAKEGPRRVSVPVNQGIAK